MLKVLLVEDDFDLAETVIDYLSLESIDCDYASNGIAGLQLIEKNQYDVIMLDLNLPRLDGYTLCGKVRFTGNDTPVLMLTARDRLNDKLAGFEAGTDDYLVKPFEMLELVARLQALSKRRSGQAQQLRCDDLVMNLSEGELTRAGRSIKISPIGWQLLETLLRAAPAVVSKQKLLDSVWGNETPDSDCLKVHIFHLRKAIDAPFENHLLQTVTGQGFAIRAPRRK